MLAGCSDDEKGPPQLPAATQTGKNIFACYIDGKRFVPRSATTGSMITTREALRLWGSYPLGTYNELDAADLKSEHTGTLFIHLQGLELLGEGEYIIDESNGMTNYDGHAHNYMHCRVYDDESQSYKDYWSYHNSGIVKITRHRGDSIISGLFSGTVRNPANPQEEIKITEGRFDINKYKLYQHVFP